MMTESALNKVTFIGLGKMGTPIALNILKAGFDLTVYNRTPGKMDVLADRGANIATSPKEAAAGSDFVITCLMDDQSVLENTSGEDGLLAGLKPGGVHIGTATVSPSCAAKLDRLHNSHGSHYISAPIFGRPDAAEAGTLLTYVAGNAEVIGRCERLFSAYTQTHIYMGEDVKVVNSIKLAMNFVLVSLIEIFSEVYTFSEKSGMDAEFTEKLIRTVLAHPVLGEYTTRLRTGDFEPAAFALQAGFKDVSLMLQAASEVQAPLLVASTIRDKLVTALACGMENKDWSAIHEVTRMEAGL